jgi:hypothetical protein
VWEWSRSLLRPMRTTPTSAQRYACQRSAVPRVRQDSPLDLTNAGDVRVIRPAARGCGARWVARSRDLARPFGLGHVIPRAHLERHRAAPWTRRRARPSGDTHSSLLRDRQCGQATGRARGIVAKLGQTGAGPGDRRSWCLGHERLVRPAGSAPRRSPCGWPTRSLSRQACSRALSVGSSQVDPCPGVRSGVGQDVRTWRAHPRRSPAGSCRCPVSKSYVSA